MVFRGEPLRVLFVMYLPLQSSVKTWPFRGLDIDDTTLGLKFVPL